MNFTWVFKILLCLIFSNRINAIGNKDFANKDYLMVEVKGDYDLHNIQELHPDWEYEYEIDFLDNFHVFSMKKDHQLIEKFSKYTSIKKLLQGDKKLIKREDYDFLSSLNDNNVTGVHLLPRKQLVKRFPVPVSYGKDVPVLHSRENTNVDSSLDEIAQVAEEFGINDPIFKEQWHIKNAFNPGHDVNVIPVWRKNITGRGVVTALIDDGLDYESIDLKDNYCPEGSWDYNDNRPNPKPELTNDYHGTRCAAEIAASRGNDYCGVGVAYDSKVSGIRILSGEITSEEEAAAMIYGLDVNDIYSCSWGPPDNGRSMDEPDKLIKSAILKGIQEGRKGKGALYVFASGNGGSRGDTCNFDGYTNSIYSLTVTAIDYKGLHPNYAESCTAVMVSTYSSGSGEHIHTTDIHEQCTANHGGTSAAAPLAAGIYALVLEANPELTWRDVQYLTVLSAAEIEPYDPSWQNSAIEGRKYSPKYGWGKIDAEKMVDMAQNNWTLLKPQAWYYMPYQQVNKKIEKKIDEIEDNFEISNEVLRYSNFEKVEQLTITVDIDSQKRGDVEVDLISPNGIVSKLAEKRPRDTDKGGFKKWTFSTVAHWGEEGTGNWTIKVRNVGEENTINFKGWQLKAFGECIDPELAKRFDIDEDYSLVNNEDYNKNVENGKSLETPNSSETGTSNAETAHTTSEVGIKPTNTGAFGASPLPSEENKPNDGNDGNTAHAHKPTHHYVIYFVSLIVIGFIASLWIFKKGKKGGARRLQDYEFDIIRPEDDESSRFEFEDLEDDEDAHEFHIESSDEDDHHPHEQQQRQPPGMNSDSEFDLGSSYLSGHEKSNTVIEDVRQHEKKQNTESSGMLHSASSEESPFGEINDNKRTIL